MHISVKLFRNKKNLIRFPHQVRMNNVFALFMILLYFKTFDGGETPMFLPNYNT